MAKQSPSKSKSTTRATKQSRNSKSLVSTSKLSHIDLTRLPLRAQDDCFLSRSLTVDQTTDIVLYSADKYTKAVYTQEFGYVEQRRPDLPQTRAHVMIVFTSVFHLERRWSPAAPTRTLCPSRLCCLTTRRSEDWRWTADWRTRTLTWPPPLCEYKVMLISGICATVMLYIRNKSNQILNFVSFLFPTGCDRV